MRRFLSKKGRGWEKIMEERGITLTVEDIDEIGFLLTDIEKSLKSAMDSVGRLYEYVGGVERDDFGVVMTLLTKIEQLGGYIDNALNNKYRGSVESLRDYLEYVLEAKRKRGGISD